MSDPRYAAVAAVTLSLLLAGCSGGSSSAKSSAPEVADTPPPVRTVSYDEDADGTPEMIEQVTYERTFNKPTDYRFDDENDGIWDYLGSYQYDDSGNLLVRAWDTDADGIDDVIETRTFDSEGRVLTLSFDLDGDSIVDRVDTSTYDSDGNRLVYARDDDGDGIDDYVETRTYSTDGDVLSLALENTGDGVVDRVESWTYSAPGAKSIYTLDSNADSVIDDRWIYTYTSDVKLLTLRKDLGDDTLIDYSRVDTYTDLPDGGFESDIAIDSDNDSAVDEVWFRSYNADRGIVDDHRDTDNDGLFDFGTTWQRDAFGRVTQRQSFRDEVLVRSVTTTFNSDGNPTLEEVDQDADGDVDQRTQTTYDDWDIGEVTVQY